MDLLNQLFKYGLRRLEKVKVGNDLISSIRKKFPLQKNRGGEKTKLTIN